VHAELRAQGVAVSRKHIARLMRLEGLRARVRKRYRCTTMSDHDQPVPANLLHRRFEAERPNQRWVGDVTELVTGDGKLFLAVILDLFSRMVVGWALSATNDRHLALRALEQALRRRCPEAGLLHHTDQGSPYASGDYQRVLTAHGIVCSMSRRGSAHDNAAMESWFSTMKFELGERFETHALAKTKQMSPSRVRSMPHTIVTFATRDLLNAFLRRAPSQLSPRHDAGIIGTVLGAGTHSGGLAWRK